MRIPIDDFPAHQSLHATFHKRCTACGRKFKTEHDLIAHVKKDHVSKDLEGLRCTQCGMYVYFLVDYIFGALF